MRKVQAAEHSCHVPDQRQNGREPGSVIAELGKVYINPRHRAERTREVAAQAFDCERRGAQLALPTTIEHKVGLRDEVAVVDVAPVWARSTRPEG